MTQKTLLILGLLILFTSATFAQFEKCSSFDELESLAKAYSQKNSIDSSILAMEYSLKRFPNEEERAINILAFLYTRTGNTSKAIELWSSGLEKGHFYGLNNRVYDKYFNDNPDFEKLREIEKERNDTSHIEYQIILPVNYNSNISYPIIFIFHGNNRNLESAKKVWTSQFMKDHYISVFLQSYAHSNSVNYRWIAEDEKTKNEFKEIYDNVISEYSIDTNKIIFAGMSAGGKIVLDFVFNELVPVFGMVLNCPVVPDSISDQAITRFVEKHKKIGIITGEKDFALNKQKDLMNKIDNQGGVNKFTINEGVGHTFIDDFSNLFDEYLKWVIE